MEDHQLDVAIAALAFTPGGEEYGIDMLKGQEIRGDGSVPHATALNREQIKPGPGMAAALDTEYLAETARLMPGAEMGWSDAERIAVRYSTSSIRLH